MSKNIYKVDSRKNLDLIIEKNFLRPICVVFVKESDNKDEYVLTQESLKVLAKECSYCIILLVNFDKFTDYNDMFKDIKNSTPYFMTFFKNKQITSIEEKEKFLENVIDRISAINLQYIEKLTEAFDEQRNKTSTNNQPATTDNNQSQIINNQSQINNNNNQPQINNNNNQPNNTQQQIIYNQEQEETSNCDDNFSKGHHKRKQTAMLELMREVEGLNNL